MDMRMIAVGLAALAMLAGCRPSGGSRPDSSSSPGFGDPGNAALPKADADRRDVNGNDVDKTGGKPATKDIEHTSGNETRLHIGRIDASAKRLTLEPGAVNLSFEQFAALGGNDPASLQEGTEVLVERSHDGELRAIRPAGRD